jgi:coenzyme F420-reducing hydrogenase gamma subunit
MSKLKVGWFTFTCCEDSTIIFTELLNTYWSQWREKMEFVHAKVLQEKNRWEEMDIAFVEGAISSQAQEEKLKRIRSLAKKLIAIGACACTGMPSAQRNHFDAPTKEEIAGLLLRFRHADRVRTVKEVVPVDDQVQGCPMVEQQFLMILNKYLNPDAHTVISNEAPVK